MYAALSLSAIDLDEDALQNLTNRLRNDLNEAGVDAHLATQPAAIAHKGTTRTIRTKSAKILISDLGVRQDFIKNREALH